MLLSSTLAFRKVSDISPEILKKLGIKGLILDVDNTLTTHDNPRPADGVLEWLDLMKKNNIKMIIVSNNHFPRIKPFADMLGLDFIPDGKKPLSVGFKKAMQKMGISNNEIAVVGDQIYTDVLGANLMRLKMLYVVPIEKEKTMFFKFKRKMEIPFLPKNFYK